MPLLHRSEFRPQQPSSDLSPADLVFYYPDTGEVFREYADYLDHYWLYASRIWSCSTTGKGGLTFREALLSERAAAERLEQRFRSSLYLEPLCRLVHHFAGRLDDLVDAVAEIFQKSYVPGETYVDGGGKQASVRRVFIAHADTSDLEPVRYSPELARAVLEKRFEFARMRYELEDGRILPAPLAVLNRKAPPVPKTLLKQKIREISSRDPWHGAPLVVQNPVLVQQFQLPEALPTPEMQRAKAEYEERRMRLEEPAAESSAQAADVEKPREEPEPGVTTEANKKRPGKQTEPELVDDLLVDHSADPPRPEPEQDFIVDRVSFGDVLMIWNFLNQFGKQVLMLSPFSLDDFEGALAYPPGHSPLIDAVFYALLRLLLSVSSDPACSRDLRDFVASSSKSGTLGLLRRTLSPASWPQVLVEMVRNMKLPPETRRLFTEQRQRIGTEQVGIASDGAGPTSKDAEVTEQAVVSTAPHRLPGSDGSIEPRDLEDDNSYNENDDGNNHDAADDQMLLWNEPRSPLVSNRVVEVVLTIMQHGYGQVPLSGRLVVLSALCEEAMATERVRRVLDAILVERAEVARSTRQQLMEKRRVIREQIGEAEEALFAFEEAHGIRRDRGEHRAATQSDAQCVSASMAEQQEEHSERKPHSNGKKSRPRSIGDALRTERAASLQSGEEGSYADDASQSGSEHDDDDGDDMDLGTHEESTSVYNDDDDGNDLEPGQRGSESQTGAVRSHPQRNRSRLSGSISTTSAWNGSLVCTADDRPDLSSGDDASQYTPSTERGALQRVAQQSQAKLDEDRKRHTDANGYLSTPDVKRLVRLSRQEALAAERERRAQERRQFEIEREHARLIARRRTLQKELRRERETYGEQMAAALSEYSVRTTPLGLDRDLNRYWFFHGEGRLFIEKQPNADEPPVWSYYASKSQVDAFLLHLNTRGRRESALHRRILRSYNWIISAMRKRNQTMPTKRLWASERPSRTRQAPESRLAWFRYENKLATETPTRT